MLANANFLETWSFRSRAQYRHTHVNTFRAMFQGDYFANSY